MYRGTKIETKNGSIPNDEMERIREEITRMGVSVDVLAERYGVSTQSMRIRLRSRLNLTTKKLRMHGSLPQIDEQTDSIEKARQRGMRQQRAILESRKSRSKRESIGQPWSDFHGRHVQTSFRIIPCQLHSDLEARLYTWDERGMLDRMAKETRGRCECEKVMVAQSAD